MQNSCWTQNCTAVCPDGPDPSTVCEGEYAFVYDSDNYICKVVTGTKDCTGGEGIPLIGTCKYTSSTEGADCSEEGVDFLTYSWTATWTWAPENEGESPPCETGYIFWNETGKCYYDPNGKSTQCVGGRKTVPCPAQLKLPFFGPYNIIAAIILIALIYAFLILKTRRHTK